MLAHTIVAKMHIDLIINQLYRITRKIFDLLVGFLKDEKIVELAMSASLEGPAKGRYARDYLGRKIFRHRKYSLVYYCDQLFAKWDKYS